MKKGFTLVEILVAIMLAGFLWAGLSAAYVGLGENWEKASRSFDVRQQQRVIVEEITRKIRKAVPGKVKLLEGPEEEGIYRRIELNPNYNMEKKIAFYQRGDNILKGVKNPGQTRFTGMSIGLNAGELSFKSIPSGIKIKICKGIMSMETIVFARGEVNPDG